jgi:NAD(P)-dependent dehydrogenase (short-subunit alcohol dehydrogenase family)
VQDADEPAGQPPERVVAFESPGSYVFVEDLRFSSPARPRGLARAARAWPRATAVARLTKHLPPEQAPDRIRVNCHCPGVIRTEAAMKYVEQIAEEAFIKTNAGANLIPRIGEPEDIGNLVCFLASKKASFIN